MRTASKDCELKFSAMDLLVKSLLISLLMRCKMSSGVPAGANTPIQVLD